jgi:hypothetical protein
LKIRFCVILPIVYAIIALSFEAGCFSKAGHGTGCEYLYRAGIPLVYLFPQDLSLFVIWAFLAGLAQYFLLGLIIDKLIAWKRS